MKKLHKVILPILIAVFTLTNASGNILKNGDSKLIVNCSTADLAIEKYIAVMTEGEWKSNEIEHLFTTSFTQQILGSTLVINEREPIISFLKKNKGVIVDCETSFNVIEKSTDYMVAKVTMEFNCYTKYDLVLLVNDGESWKVSQSIHSYV